MHPTSKRVILGKPAASEVIMIRLGTTRQYAPHALGNVENGWIEIRRQEFRRTPKTKIKITVLDKNRENEIIGSCIDGP